MKNALIAAVALFLSTGCAGSFEEARNPNMELGAPPQSERCADLDDRYQTWGFVAKTSGVLAGASGIATWPAPNEDMKIGLAIGSGVTAAVAAGSLFVSESAASSWARECAK